MIRPSMYKLDWEFCVPCLFLFAVWMKRFSHGMNECFCGVAFYRSQICAQKTKLDKSICNVKKKLQMKKKISSN